jgi:hypothetical protein
MITEEIREGLPWEIVAMIATNMKELKIKILRRKVT